MANGKANEKLRRRKFRSERMLLLLLALFLASLLGYFLYQSYSPKVIEYFTQAEKKVIVISIDAAEAELFEEYMDAGQLPHLAALRESGFYTRIDTRYPQKAAAWSSFATGMNPGKTGIFDEIVKDEKTYRPKSALLTVSQANVRPKFSTNRHGNTLWNITSSYGLKTSLITVPATFPPEPVTGNMLSGYGTPDMFLDGQYFYIYENLPDGKVKNDYLGKLIFADFRQQDEFNDIVKVTLPINKKEVPMTIMRDRNSLFIRFKNHKFRVQEKQWSEWKQITFYKYFVIPQYGMVRFYVKRLNPLELYITPVNIDPRKPYFPIADKGYAEKLADNIGVFPTFGTIDYKALDEGALDEAGFITMVNDFFRKRKDALFQELAGKPSLLVANFDEVEAIEKGFWRFQKPESPAFDLVLNMTYHQAILNQAKDIDDMVGDIMDRYVDENTVLMVVSPHGMNSYDYSVNLNSWLSYNGYLDLKTPPGFTVSRQAESQLDNYVLFQNIDFAHTKAFALGKNQIYINLKGREPQGIVEQNEYQQLRDEIAFRLAGTLRHQGKKIVKEVTQREGISGMYDYELGDIQVSFIDGYRQSYDSALGGVPKDVIEPIKGAVSADYWEYTGNDGFLIMNVGGLNTTYTATIYDIMPTVLHILDFPVPADADGTSLLPLSWDRQPEMS